MTHIGLVDRPFNISMAGPIPNIHDTNAEQRRRIKGIVGPIVIKTEPMLERYKNSHSRYRKKQHQMVLS